MKIQNLLITPAIFAALSVFAVSASAQQDRAQFIRATFSQVNKASKGALGQNSYQTADGRVPVVVNGVLNGPPSKNLITAAFRSTLAGTLAERDFYVGNRFSTNYWHLHDKYLSSPQEKLQVAFRIDHARFLNTPAMLGDAQSIARHMIMEKFYMIKFPATRITLANLQRGTADADHEKKYYGYLTEYLAKYASTPADYLVLYELQRRFDLIGDANGVSLQSLRDTVANIYSELEAEGESSSKVARFRDIRNSIHNYMTPDVLPMIRRYLANYESQLSSSQVQSIRSLQNTIQKYYQVSKDTLVAQAGALLDAELAREAKTILEPLRSRGNPPQALEFLSRFTTKVRESVATSKKPNSIHWIMRAQAFLQSELAATPLENNSAAAAGSGWAPRARVSIDAVYANGLISRPAWVNAHQLLAGTIAPENLRRINAALEALFVEAHQNLEKSLQPALGDWKLVESTMETVLDDTLRASLLSELNQITVKIKSQLPSASSQYSIENEGVAFGYLVYVPKGSTSAQIALLEKNMIPIFAELPLDLSVVAGIITEQPQTPLSHVSIKSKARGTPNLYFKDASSDPLFKALLAKRALVRVSFLNDKIEIREAQLAEAQAAWAAGSVPSGSVQIKSDLNERRIRSTRELSTKDIISIGAKAANYGEASRILPANVVQDAFGLPFAYYKEFIEQNSFDGTISIAEKIRQVVQDPRSKTDRQFLTSSLEAIQTRMTSKETLVSPSLINSLTTILGQTYPNTKMRFRSSTNSEDLPNFSGAGLYDSYTYKPGDEKKSLAVTLKKVWASVMNVRAFDEREHYGIPHLDVYMGMLISPSFPNETANGVAVTRNDVKPELGYGVYINTQSGEDAVTNPDASMTPEELLVQVPSMNLNYLKFSSKTNAAIMTDAEAILLTQYLMLIHNHFKMIVDPENKNPNFAMDMEWKIDIRNGKREIFIKQARPYVSN